MEQNILKEYETIEECLFTQPETRTIKCVTDIDNTAVYNKRIILGHIDLSKIKYLPKPNKGYNKYINHKFLYINKRGSL